MAALTGNLNRKFTQQTYEPAELRYNVAASQEIFSGAMVCKNTAGDIVPAADALNNVFVGVSIDYYNETAAAATTDYPVRVRNGTWFESAIDSAVTDADMGKIVFCKNDNEVTLTVPTADTAGTTRCGTIAKVVDSGTVVVNSEKDQRVL